MDEILKQLIDLLIEQGEVDLKSIYIDGTKIEANANRYTFVWKKSIIKYQTRLIEKISEYFNINDELSKGNLKKLVLKEFNNVRNICKSKDIVFVYGEVKEKQKNKKDMNCLKSGLISLIHMKNI